MEDIIQIKCPFDGAVLSVRNQPGIETKNVTCPVCGHKYPFSQFRRVKAAAYGQDPDTVYPGEEKTATELPPAEDFTLGKLLVMGSDVAFQLRPGRNVVGRKASKSAADFQIDTAEGRRMSREHIVVEVKKVPGRGFVHYLSLFKEKVNPTFVGDDPLLYGDCIVLSHGDILKLPDAFLKFVIPDDEGTL